MRSPISGRGILWGAIDCTIGEWRIKNEKNRVAKYFSWFYSKWQEMTFFVFPRSNLLNGNLSQWRAIHVAIPEDKGSELQWLKRYQQSKKWRQQGCIGRRNSTTLTDNGHENGSASTLLQPHRVHEHHQEGFADFERLHYGIYFGSSKYETVWKKIVLRFLIMYKNLLGILRESKVRSTTSIS